MQVMQKIAFENNLAETAFFVKSENGYLLRWFTPELEIDLCGHATLASAHILLLNWVMIRILYTLIQ
jgi:PhzF family phenazine biosynthesis protein